jgi:succinate-semialdehyde dehydrogenase/glutarate-semialdehyde dehydrogenase
MPDDSMSIQSINPTTGEPIRDYDLLGAASLKDAIKAAQAASVLWQEQPITDRTRLFSLAAVALREHAGEYAKLMAMEMGKPITAGRAEIEKCAWVCDYYAKHAERFLASEQVATEANRSYVSFEPLGVILAVMPWNFPFWQVFRFAAPALMAGNTGLLKHASNVPGCALAIEEVFQKAGFPSNVFRTLFIDHRQLSTVIKHPAVQAVTLTGSTDAGRVVGQLAGKFLKKTVMELGGSDPYLILEDANVEEAVELCVTSRLMNSGQSCIAAKRFIVVEARREEFVRRFVERMRNVRMGDPMDPTTEVGPQARIELRDELHRQVQESVAKGAHCVLGGVLPDGPGAFYPPTVLTDVKKGMPAYREELFGPVAAIVTVRNERAAIRVANDSVFGLGAAVFTGDAAKGERIAAKELQAGCCVVNDLVRTDPRLPFGGTKQSGHGRELSRYGLKEFVNIKTVSVREG